MRSVLQVLQKNPFKVRGGIEECALQFARSFKRIGLQNGFLYFDSKKSRYDLADGSNCYALRELFTVRSITFGSFPIVSLVRFFREFDTILLHHPSPFFQLLCIFFRKKIIIYYHSDIVRQKILNFFYLPFLKLHLKRADLVLVSTQTYAENSVVLGSLTINRKVVPIPANEKLKKYSDTLILNRLSRDSNFFLVLGAVRSYKGLSTVLRAGKLASELGFQFVLAGPGTEELICHGVVGLGEISDAQKATLLRCCSAVVSSSESRAEAYGISLVEGLLFGKPLITTRINSGPSFINREGETGLTFDVGNHYQLISQCKAIIDSGSASYRQACVVRYKKLFSRERFDRAVDEIFK